MSKRTDGKNPTFQPNPSRTIWIAGPINDSTVTAVASSISSIDSRVHPSGIHVFITSTGGDVAAGMAIYDYLMTRKNKIVTVGSGDCSSIAVLMLQAGAQRFLTPHTNMLLHQAIVDLNGGLAGQSLSKIANNIIRDDNVYADILWHRIKQSGKSSVVSRQSLQAILDGETYLTAKEAVDYGIADGLTYIPTYETSKKA